MQKQKVFYLSYSQMNKVVSKNMELEQINNHVFYAFMEKDKYDSGNSKRDLMRIIIKVKNVYFDILRCRRSEVHLYKDTAEEEAKQYIQNILIRLAEGKFITNLMIKVFQESGENAQPLIDAREAYYEKKRLNQEEERNKSRECVEEVTEIENNRLSEEKKKFLAGEKITAIDFLILIQKDGFKIPIQTMGTIRKSVKRLKSDGTVSIIPAKKGKRNPSLSGSCKAARDYYQFLIQNNNQ